MKKRKKGRAEKREDVEGDIREGEREKETHMGIKAKLLNHTRESEEGPKKR